MDREGSGFSFLREKFPRISIENLKPSIFDGRQIRELMKDPMSDKALSEAELSVWQSLKSVATNLRENYRSTEYEKEIEELQKNFCQFGARMPVKLHFLWSHLDYFPKNCGDLSEEQGERFHPVFWIMKECYQGRWGVKFLNDYCWCLKRDAVAVEHRRKSLKRPFIHEWFLLCIFQFIMAQWELSAYISALNFALFV